MDNNEIAKRFSLLSKLMEIHGENSFKSKTYSIAAYKIEQLTVGLQTLSAEKIFSINGIGDAIGNKILELTETGNMKVLDELISKTPEGILEMMNNRLYQFWGNLDEGLITGLPQNEAKTGEDFFGLMYQDPNKLKAFVNAMSGIQMGNFMTFAQNFNFSKYKTLTDVGGSAGLLSLMVAKHQPHMNCITFDLPPVEPIAKATIQQFQLGDRVKAESGDFFTNSFPNADIIVMGNILHDWDEENKLALMKKAYEALPSGGAFAAIENIIDDERKQNVFGMMMSLNMLIETGKGFDYTFADFNNWAKTVGFKSTSLLPLTGPSSAAIAYK